MPINHGPAIVAMTCTRAMINTSMIARRCGEISSPSSWRASERSRGRPVAAVLSCSCATISASGVSFPCQVDGSEACSMMSASGSVIFPTSLASETQLGTLREQLAIGRHAFEQLTVRADSCDAPTLEKRYAIGQHDGGRAMGHDECGGRGEHPAQRGLHDRLGVHVEGR